MFTLPVLIGIALAPAIVALGRLSGLDRDRALYPVTLIVIAAYYVLFATMGGAQALLSELIAAAVFVVIAIVGFRTSLWWVAAGIAGHGVFDWVVHPHLIANPGMPVFWPAFCGSIDVALGVLIAILLLRGAIPERGPAPDDLDALFTPLDADPQGALDAVHDTDNMPLASEPAGVRNDLAAVLAGPLTGDRRGGRWIALHTVATTF